MMNLSDKKTLVVGLGKSGLAASRLLQNKGAEVWISEKEDNSELRDLARDLVEYGVRVELGKHSRYFVEGKELVVLSPGAGPQCPVLGWAEQYKIPIISELELASWYVSYPLIAVTGTNGKSTVTSLIEHIFRRSGKNVAACGNIGLPFSKVILQKKKLDLAVVEVSSFQLKYIQSFRPDVAVWLNFSCDHLDHHRSMDEYLRAKLNIFKNQGPSDWAVVNSKELDRIRNKVRCKIWGQPPYFQEKYGGCPHILENISASAAVAQIYGIDSEDIQSSIDTFQPLPHRLQYVATVRGVEFIDDSKATNIASVSAALFSVKAPIILILGGRDKGDDFTKLRDLVLEKVSSIIAVGEAQDKIWNQLNGAVSVEKVSKFNNAVSRAFQIAAPGATVLLSPGCSSFDMFKDYKERGESFQRCVLKLNDKCQSTNDKIITNNKCQMTKLV